MKPIFKEVEGAWLSRQTEGRNPVIVPAALDYVIREGELFDYLMEKFKFSDYIESLRNRVLEGAESKGPAAIWGEQLKKDLKDGRIEIKLSFEYSKLC